MLLQHDTYSCSTSRHHHHHHHHHLTLGEHHGLSGGKQVTSDAHKADAATHGFCCSTAHDLCPLEVGEQRGDLNLHTQTHVISVHAYWTAQHICKMLKHTCEHIPRHTHKHNVNCNVVLHVKVT